MTNKRAWTTERAPLTSGVTVNRVPRSGTDTRADYSVTCYRAAALERLGVN